jgi:site-specific recombinase XerD
LNQKPQIILTYTEHNQTPVVKIVFDYNQSINLRIKQIPLAKWSKTLDCWYISRNEFNLGQFFEQLKQLAFIDYSGLKTPTKLLQSIPVARPLMKESRQVEMPKGYIDRLEQQRYSESTIKTYTHYFKDFIIEFENRDLKDIKNEEINGYILKLIKEKDISSSQQNQRINAIKFYFEKVLRREKEYYKIDRPRKERKLPDVLSKEEVAGMMKATENVKHKCLIALIYSCGLRRSEAINLKLEDIDSQRMLIKINGAKGKKDRYVQLAKGILTLLREYYKKEKPQTWLFEGTIGKQYSATSIFNTVKDTAKKAGIKKRVYPHILRHSFATHHLEQGTDLRFIQEFLGHESSKTTEIYTHVSKSELSKFRNPIDDILDSG